MGSRSAVDVLLRDEKLAEWYHVDAAPTIFTNGTRKVGFNSPEALWSAIRAAAFDAKSGDPRGVAEGQKIELQNTGLYGINPNGSKVANFASAVSTTVILVANRINCVE